MTKHTGKRRTFRPYLKGQIELDIGLGTLAADTLILEPAGDTVDEQAWLSSVKALYSLSDYTPATGDGPVIVGLAHSDYSAAEIEEWIEQTQSWSRFDLIGQEIAKRKIRRIGQWELNTPVADTVVLNDGKPLTTKCGWMLGTGQTVEFWVYNAGTALTTGAVAGIRGHANLWPTQ